MAIHMGNGMAGEFRDFDKAPSSEWSEDDLIQYVDSHIVTATDRLVHKYQDWSDAVDYYNGIIPDMVIKQPGQSETVSRDVRSTIRKLLPIFIRSLFKKGNIVKYMPKGPNQVEMARDITNYINKVVFPKSRGDDALHDVTFDALLLSGGILKWEVAHEYKTSVVRSNEMPPEIAMSLVESLDAEDKFNILDVEENADGNTVSLVVRERKDKRYLRLRAIPRGNFLIDPEAACIEDAVFCGEFCRKTRSDLVSMGIDKDLVYSLETTDESIALSVSGFWNNNNTSIYSDPSKSLNDEDALSTLDNFLTNDMSSEKILLYDLYIKLDLDGDGISEIYNLWLLYGGNEDLSGSNLSGRNYSIAKLDLVDEVPYSVCQVERVPYSFEGKPIVDDVKPIQRIKTTFLREAIDNTRLQTVPITYVDISKVKNPADLFNRRRGKPIVLKNNADPDKIVKEYRPEFVADKLQQFLNYMDFVLKDRTGISDMTGGVEPSKLQHMPATNAELLSEGGTIQGDVMFRTLVLGGVKDAFNGLYRLTLKNPDLVQGKHFNLGGVDGDQFASYNPEDWDPDIECSVVASIGAGSKALDLSNAFGLLNLQEKITASLGLDNPFVKPQNLSNLLSHITELMGYPTDGVFFSEPTEQEIAALKEKQREAKREEDDREIRKEQMKIKARADIERVQMQADIVVQREKTESTKEVKIFESVLREKIKRLEILARLKEHDDEMELEYDRLLVEIEKIEKEALKDIGD